ncbi:uncharacterized protein LOC122757509 [Drosophila mojavensis]|uniref:uncharacterized protein LOC122757509 n=1 Tax=Drosophila mojavensis TaxID=7230 RepID=UPI001CD099AA|nr:uncharacterized protein LOC122757509 [Drosophila mojavensis]
MPPISWVLKTTFHGNTADMEMFAAERGMEFVFIPPRAPHFGGLWEAAVKSAKGLLLKAMGSARLRQDEVATVLVEVEAVLNSRPMVAPSSNPNDGEVLTPGHFLIGATLVPLPIASTEPVDDAKLTLLKRWQLTSNIKRRFWNDWSRDYLLSLQQKSKWTKERQNVQVGAVVLVGEDNAPPQQWMLGVVTEAIVGGDGRVRVIVVKTKNGTYKRAIHRVAPLPLH